MARSNRTGMRWVKRGAFALLVLSAVIFGALIFARMRDVEKEGELVLVKVRRGDVERIVSCTGTLRAVETVDIGAQVSGTIESVHVDYNDIVEEGQVLLELETALYESDVEESKASVAMSKAELKKARADFTRVEKLHAKGFATDEDFIIARTQVETAKASLKSTVERKKKSQIQLEYTVIKSPIDGTVIARNVEKGQTIQSSFSTPSLFIIAGDLSAMQIEASVDETDIGLIEEGQEVRFTVQAHQDRQYRGTVRQIRLQPEVLQNVVNYTVVVDAMNEDGSLLPGMTATVDVIVESRKDVLVVPNEALSFVLLPEMIGSPRKEGLLSYIPLLSPGPEKAPLYGGSGMGGAMKVSEGSQRLWTMDVSGRCVLKLVETGLSDGTVTELMSGGEIVEGATIVAGFKKGAVEKKERTRIFGPPKGEGPPPRF